MTFQGRFNYPPFVTHADFALISHEHIDHNYVGDLRGPPVIVRHAWQDAQMRITSQTVWHDKFNGTKFGSSVSMKIIEADGLRLCHMGDCGELLNEGQIEAMGKLDVLCIPVGGFYTLNGDEAAEVAQRIDCRTIIPCHYQTPLCKLPIEGPERFLSHFDRVVHLDQNRVNASDLPSGVVVLRDSFQV